MDTELSPCHDAGAISHSPLEPPEEGALVEGDISRQVLERLDAMSEGQVALEARLLSCFARLEQVIERTVASTQSASDSSLCHGGAATLGPSSRRRFSQQARVSIRADSGKCRSASTPQMFSAMLQVGASLDKGTDKRYVEKEDGSCLMQAGVPLRTSLVTPLFDSLLPSQPSNEMYCTSASAKRDIPASKPLPMLLGTSPWDHDLAPPCDSADQANVNIAKPVATSARSSLKWTDADAGKQAGPSRSSEQQNCVTRTSSVASDDLDTVLSFSEQELLRQDIGLNPEGSRDSCEKELTYTSSRTTGTTSRMLAFKNMKRTPSGPSAASTRSTLTSRPAIRKGGTLSIQHTAGSRCRVSVTALVRSPIFGYLICALLLANAATVGMEVNFKAANTGQEVPEYFSASEVTFCILFAAELTLRGYVHGSDFFQMEGWQWNVFEAIAVGLQFVELIVDAAVNMQGWEISSISNLARLLQLLRIFRVLRIVHFVRRLDKLVYLIIASWHYFLWTVALLMLLTYMLGVFLTQLVVEHGESHPDMIAPGTQLHQYFSSIGISVLSLFQAISGGIEWGELVACLTESISPVLAPLVSFYVAFVLLVILNLVTGVYVEAAQKMTKKDKDNDLLQKVRMFFTQTDSDDQGSITWAEFRQQLDKPGMQKLLTDIGLGLCKPEEFFCVLDTEGTGQVTADDIAFGGLLLQQPARAIDVALLLHNTKQTTMMLRRLLRKLEMRIVENFKPSDTVGESFGTAALSRRSSMASLGEVSLAA